MDKKLDEIQPHKAYKLNEVGQYLNMHPVNIRKILNSPTEDREQFMKQFNPVKVAGSWRILGENLLIGLGSVSYQEYLKASNTKVQDTSGAADPAKKYE
jgi:hypothetical protein